MSSQEEIKRYPGIRSFEWEDKQIFFGRDQEIEELFSLIRVNPLVVLFAKSGIGKTSLLNAGIMPLLTDVHPMPIRFQQIDTPPIEKVTSFIQPLAVEEFLQKYASGHSGLWELLKSRELKPFEDVKPILFIFDQFEEFFAHQETHRQALAQELAYLINNQLPGRVQERLLKVPREERTHEMMGWFTPVNVKFLFIIRSDKLHLMNELSKRIPNILHTRFLLEPLKGAQARKAIIHPAQLKGEQFQSLPFLYSSELLDDIEKNLQNEKGEIESWQLQIICEHIEGQVLQLQEQSENEVTAGPHLLGGRKGIERILNNFYKSKIAELPTDGERKAAKAILEKRMVEQGRRIRADERVLLRDIGVDTNLLQKLVDKRLLRVENTSVGRSYEISHDTLVPAILQEKKILDSDFTTRGIKSFDWQFILGSLQERTCVVILGNDFYQDQDGATYRDLLLRISDLYEEDFLYLENEGLFEIPSKGITRIRLERLLKNLSDRLDAGERYRLLARLNFPLLITLSSDNLLMNTFQQERMPFIHGFFDKTKRQAWKEDFSGTKRPVLYQLMGSIAHPDSLVLTNEDIFEHLEKLSHPSSLPVSLEAALQKARLFLFIGVNFKNWYVKPILWRLLRKAKGLKMAVGDSNQYDTETALHFKGTFGINFIDVNSMEFLKELAVRQQELGMENTLDKSAGIENIKALLRDGNTSEALESLLVFLNTIGDEGLALEARMLSSRINELNSRQFSGTLSGQDFRIKTNQTSQAILDLLNRVK